MSTPAYRGCPLRDAPFLWCEVHRQSLRPCRSAAERDYNVPHKDHPFGLYAHLLHVLQYRYGAGLASFPPPRNGGPAFFFALFTRLPRREILRSSPTGRSRKSA